MKRQLTNILFNLLLLPFLVLAGCDSGTQPSSSTATAAPASTPASDIKGPLPIPTFDGTPGPITGPTIGSAEPQGSPTALPTPSGTIVDSSDSTLPSTPEESAPTPTTVTATGTGDALTALQALEQLKPKALAWSKDARLGMLTNTRPGQQKNLLGTTLGDPNVNEATPGGKGRNWTLVAYSPSGRAVLVLSTDGTQVDLIREGAVTEYMIARFRGPHLAELDLASLDLSTLADSDAVLDKLGDRGRSPSISVALIAPDGLGLGPLPTPSPTGDSPQLAYEAFSTNPRVQTFIFFDARTGNVILDSSAP